jgi:hypothetical protein
LRASWQATSFEGARKTLAEMRDNNEAGYSTVKHTIWITHTTDQAAVIVDRYVAQTLKLDPESKAPVQSAPAIEQYSDTFQLQNFDGNLESRQRRHRGDAGVLMRRCRTGRALGRPEVPRVRVPRDLLGRWQQADPIYCPE